MKALQFSGGKDSLACLYLFRDDPEVVVIWADTGNAFPHMRDFIYRTVKSLGMRLHVAKPDKPVKDWQDENGLPADIVPWDSTPMMRGMVKEPSKTSLVPYTSCCIANLWAPSSRAVHEIGATVVIRGSRASDGKVGVPDGYTDAEGITYLSPIWNWTDDEVFAYLKSVGAEIPPQYAMGGDSLDCWCCTAYMGDHGKERFAYLKSNYPHLYADAKRRMDGVTETVRAAIAGLVQEV